MKIYFEVFIVSCGARRSSTSFHAWMAIQRYPSAQRTTLRDETNAVIVVGVHTLKSILLLKDLLRFSPNNTVNVHVTFEM